MCVCVCVCVRARVCVWCGVLVVFVGCGVCRVVDEVVMCVFGVVMVCVHACAARICLCW